ncbi:Peptide chain release factor 1, mitochondrial [Naganishia albida]|nr:Peptide chain release factor 1, mitochondrial [Naganishia albida]
MQQPLRRITRITRCLEIGSLGVRRAVSPQLERTRTVSGWPHRTEGSDISQIPQQCVITRTFGTSSSRHARRNTPQATEPSTQTTLLAAIESKVKEYQHAVKQQANTTDVEEQIKLARIVKDLEPLAGAWQEYTDVKNAMTEAETLLQDPDPGMRSLASEELSGLDEQMTELLEDRLPALLLPPSATASLGAMIELKAGVGGDEAALFVEQVMRMYIRYAQTKGWRTEILSKTAGSIGTGAGTGLKDVTIKIDGEGAFGDFRFERGVHRVQRVPATESAGRVHTSTIAVVVLPVMEKIDATDDLVDESDVKTEVMRSRGAGGQHVNKTESAVRLTHIPTGITVSMQDSRSQHQNKAWAWQILRARLLDQRLVQQAEDRRKTRQSQVKGMDRSDKVRTYNFPQDRVTDHRIGLTMTGLDSVLEGEGLESVMQQLKDHQRSLRMESLLQTGEDIDE